jgi:biopolymer transport protein ExbB
MMQVFFDIYMILIITKERFKMEFLKDYVEYAVLAVLLIMSFVALSITIERYFFYKKVNLKQFKTKNEIEIGLTNNLAALSIIGSNAPYIGLLGTVGGIMIVFYDMGMQSSIDPNVIVIGLSMALKVTAVGLLVAIPTTIVYNMYLRKVDTMMGKWEDEIA